MPKVDRGVPLVPSESQEAVLVLAEGCDWNQKRNKAKTVLLIVSNPAAPAQTL
jgi:hypothetical protein